MQQKIDPLDDASALCDTLIRQYPNPLDLPPAGRWHYHQGVFLLSLLRLGNFLESESYLRYVNDWTSELIGAGGSLDFAAGELDALQAGNLLFPRLDDDPDGRFRIALDSLISVLDHFPRTDQGGFWHKLKYPDQQWLDGLYMIGPLCARYARIAHRPELLDEMVLQAELIAEGAKDLSTGLLRHGFDRSGKAEWVMPGDNRAPECWGRALGWFPAALLDMIDWFPVDHAGSDTLKKLYKNLIPPILKFQDKSTGLWFQVLDRGEDRHNWTETSCSSLFLYAMAKGVRTGLLDPSVTDHVLFGYQGLLSKTGRDSQGRFFIRDICVGTGIGDYRFYLDRPRTVNDLHGAGAFVMAALETARLLSPDIH